MILWIFLELLLNPNVKNDSFDSKYYNIVKKDCIAAYESIKDNPSLCAAIEFNKIMYKGSPKEYSLTPSINDINTFDGDIYSQILWVTTEDVSFLNQNQVIRASITKLVRK